MDIECTVQNPQELLVSLGEKYEALLRAEESLTERRAEIGDLIAGLQEASVTANSEDGGETESLRRDVEALHEMLAQRERELAEASLHSKTEDERNQEMVALEAENARLCKALERKSSQIDDLRKELEELLEASPEAREAKDYEAEINEFRRQLEADRQSLNEEIRLLRDRNAELNDASRQAELELSRERAQLARERSQLDRLREEIRQEFERADREAGVRERLAGVQRLKEEMADRQGYSNGSKQVQKENPSRWANFLRRASND